MNTTDDTFCVPTEEENFAIILEEASAALYHGVEVEDVMRVIHDRMHDIERSDKKLLVNTIPQSSLMGELISQLAPDKEIDNYFIEQCDNFDGSPEVTKALDVPGFGEFEISIRKIGNAEKNRRKVLDWLEGKDADSKPVPYNLREVDSIKKRKLNPVEFFEKNYSEFVRTNSLFAHEFRKLDSALYMNLAVTVDSGVSSLLPTKSVKVTSEIMDGILNKRIGAKSTAAAYGRLKK